MTSSIQYNQTSITTTILLLFFLVLIFLTTTTIHGHIPSSSNQTQTKPHKHDSIPYQETLTKLHFNFHDIPQGPNPTAVVIAQPANATSFGFGTLLMVDDVLTSGPDVKSKIVGRAQGMYGVAALSLTSLVNVLTFNFLEGKYNGSSISVLGWYNIPSPVREMPIVGGSGVFRMARGYALVKLYSSDGKTGTVTNEYSLFVLHSERFSGY